MKTAIKFDRRAARAAMAGGVALLLPFLSAADSQTATDAARTTLRAAAHVDFKIVIPRVLSLDVPAEMHGVLGAQNVSIYSNNRNVALGSTTRASNAARGTLILSAAARKVIAQSVSCGAGAPAVSLVCTASIP